MNEHGPVPCFFVFMYLYSITLNIDDDIHDECLGWIRETFLSELFSTGLFVSRNFLQLINDEKSGGTTYSLQLFMKSHEDYERYEAEYCYRHQEMFYSRYAGKFVEFRTLLKMLD